jgi:ligand-binding sensor domain-containing protein/DNA-binding CsgD family transcriptional regulator
LHVWALGLTTARNFQLIFDRINVGEGLPNSIVNCIFNDSYGFIWIGTEDGLVRYDSKTFRLYKENTGAQSILHNAILFLYEDEDSLFWVGTRRSLELYNRQKDTFIHFKFFPDANNNVFQQVTSLSRLSGNEYFIATDGGGLYKLILNRNKPESSVLERVKVQGGYTRFSSIYKENNSTVWIATFDHGIFKYTIPTSQWQSIQISENHDLEIRTIAGGTAGQLYIGTYTRGLCIYNTRTGQYRFFTNEPDNPKSIPSNRIWTIFSEKTGNCWIGTDGGGLAYFDATKENFITYKYLGFDNNSLSNNAVHAITIDREGNLWVGHFHGGISLSRGKPNFYSLGSNPGYSNSLDNMLVTSVLKDKDGNLWVGTDGGGINIFDKNWNRVEQKIFTSLFIDKLKNKSVLALFQDSKEFIWIGTYLDGFYRYDPKTKQIKNYSSRIIKSSIITNDDVRCFFEDKEGNLWVGTNGGGIYILDPETDKITKIVRDLNSSNSISLDWIRDIIADSYGYIWIATAFGLNAYDPVKKQFINYFQDKLDIGSLSDNMVLSVHEDKNRTLWVGTSNGLNQFNRTTNTFNKYYIQDGLPDNTIASILEDNRGNLWLSTNLGLSMLDISMKKFTNYNKTDGLLSLSFIENASYKDDSGNFYLGSIDGLIYFHPDSIIKKQISSPVIITRLLLYNKTVQIDEKIDGLVILEKDISLTKKIRLKYKHNVVSLDYVALSFRNLSSKYRYKLIGFDNEWNYDLNGKQSVTYTNLKPGNYTFVIQLIDYENIDEIPLSETKLDITIIPPFWMRNWFRGLVIITLLFLAYSWYRRRLSEWQKQKEDLKRKMLEDKLKNEKEQMQLREEKLKAEVEKQDALMNLKNSQLISYALQLTHKNDILRNINNKLSQFIKSIKTDELKKGIIELSDTINNEFRTDKDWERFEKHFNEVHGDYIKRLKREYPDLSLTYLKLCTYLKLDLSTKEIASLLNISTRGVEKARSRLRKKFNIDRTENLTAFLNKI